MLTTADFVSRTASMLALTRELAEIESPSHDKAAVDRVGSRVAAELAPLGAQVHIDRQSEYGDNVVARWPGAAQEPGFLLLCHMDTVWDLGTLAQRPLREEDGRLYGPGVYDMKGGIAVGVAALEALRAAGQWPRRSVTALFTSDEELGSPASRALIEDLARGCALALVLEPALPTGALKTERKGTGYLVIETRGRAAHAGGAHEQGRNAIEELAHHILAAQRLTDYAAGTTVNVGLVSGGGATNVVPDWASAKADLRVRTAAEMERLRQWAASRQPVIDGASVSAAVSFNRPPMPRDVTMVATFARGREIAGRLGLELIEAGTGGGSDGNFVAALGVPVLDGLGPVGDGGHAVNEHLVIASLAPRAALLAALLTDW